jgi:hypothetical protein
MTTQATPQTSLTGYTTEAVGMLSPFVTPDLYKGAKGWILLGGIG